MVNKLVTREELVTWRTGWRSGNIKVVFTNGVFDLLHVGHVQYLIKARAMGDLLIVGLNSDYSVRQFKGPKRPIVPQEERAQLLLSLRPVDYVVIFDELTAEESVRQLQPDIYVKGGDYTLADDTGYTMPSKPLPEEPVVKAYGGTVKLIQYMPGYSTTELIDRILKVYK